MEVLLQPEDVVLVGMRQQEGIHVEAPLVVGLQTLPQLLDHVRRVVVHVTGGGPDVDVDEQRPAVFEAVERHVPIADLEVRNNCGHEAPPSFSVTNR